MDPTTRETENPLAASSPAKQPLNEKTTIHVHGIGVEGWDGTPSGKGTYEDEDALRSLFEPFGEISDMVVARHRATDGTNASWAHITMADAEVVKQVLAQRTVRGLICTRYSEKLAKRSVGMVHAIGLQEEMKSAVITHQNEYTAHLLGAVTTQTLEKLVDEHKTTDEARRQLDLAGARVYPQFHDRLREVSTGNYDAGQHVSHGNLFANFLLANVLVCVVAFGVPIASACTYGDQKLNYDFMDEHWTFYMGFAAIGVVFMFGTIPAFSMILATQLPKEGEEEGTSVMRRERQRRLRNAAAQAAMHSTQRHRRIVGITGSTLVMTCPSAMLAIVVAIWLTKSAFGFPVPFLPLFVGFPMYFTLFPVVMLYLRCRGYPHDKVKTEMLKLLFLQALVLFMAMVYPFLAAMVKLYPRWELLWAALFPVVANCTKFVLLGLFRKEFLASPALAAPILANHGLTHHHAPRDTANQLVI
jgi:hypothetical protein